MGKPRKMENFRWPFAKRRQTWIAEADSILSRADDQQEKYMYADSESAKKKHLKRAASLYEHAAEFYRRAGLGLMARESFIQAMECWEFANDQESSSHAKEKASEIDTYYESDDEE